MTSSLNSTIAAKVRQELSPVHYDRAVVVVLFPHDHDAQPVAMMVDDGLAMPPESYPDIARVVEEVGGIDEVVLVVPRQTGRATEADRVLLASLRAGVETVTVRCLVCVGPVSHEVIDAQQSTSVA